jgi:RNA polymerase sigma-70 factor (ECF subfamily)
MNPATAPPTTAPPPPDLADPALREDLLRHAAARMRKFPPEGPDAEDLVHSCYERAQQRIKSFDPSKGTFRGWIHGILENLAREEWKKLKRQPKRLTRANDWADTQSLFETKARVEELHSYLAKVPEKFRKAVMMFHLNGIPHEQIAAAFGVSNNVARVWCCRGMMALRELAGKEGAR